MTKCSCYCSFKFTSAPWKDEGSTCTHKNSVEHISLRIVTQTLLCALINVTLDFSSHESPWRKENVKAAQVWFKSNANVHACFWVTWRTKLSYISNNNCSLPVCLPVCCPHWDFLDYSTNGRWREAGQDLQPNWFGRAQTLTFLTDICAAATRMGSNNPLIRRQKMDYICFAHSGLSHFTSLDWSISFMSQNAGMMCLSENQVVSSHNNDLHLPLVV